PIARTALLLAAMLANPSPSLAQSTSWRTDPAWDRGKAEWALYDAQRVVYGQPRRYEATIFTNPQAMDPGTTTKASDWRAAGTVPVFKHNCSELVPTDNYVYRFLTTCFVRRDDLRPFKIVASSQEDCGATYKQHLIRDGRVEAEQHGYFPGEGRATTSYRVPGGDAPLAFHDALSLTLRDYPFAAADPPELRLSLVDDQTDTHFVEQRPRPATVRYVGRETVGVPFGELDAHHLRVTHAAIGGSTTSDYWFAADPGLRHVMVRYEGPWGVRYELKRLDWWAYWAEPRP
ncbi:MAG: DUF3108 domain-containing protein, partial [Planctomycetota bacterium]